MNIPGNAQRKNKAFDTERKLRYFTESLFLIAVENRVVIIFCDKLNPN